MQKKRTMQQAKEKHGNSGKERWTGSLTAKQYRYLRIPK
jgi:hypothetical protein